MKNFYFILTLATAVWTQQSYADTHYLVARCVQTRCETISSRPIYKCENFTFFKNLDVYQSVGVEDPASRFDGLLSYYEDIKDPQEAIGNIGISKAQVLTGKNSIKVKNLEKNSGIKDFEILRASSQETQVSLVENDGSIGINFYFSCVTK